MNCLCRIVVIFLAGFTVLLSDRSEARQTAELIIFESDNGEQLNIPKVLRESVQKSEMEEASQKIISWFTEQAWLDVIIDSVANEHGTPNWYISRGCRYIVGSVYEIIKPDTLDYSESRFHITPEGEYFTKSAVEEFISNKLQEFEDAGFLLAGIEITEISKDSENCLIDFEIQITAGNKNRLSGIRFEGVEKNNPAYLERIAGIRNDEIITTELMDKARRNLLNSDLLISVEEPELVFQNSDAFLQFEIQEQQLNFFDGLIGFVPDADGTAQIVGNADLRLRNVITDGTNLQIRFEQLRPLVTKLFIEGEQQFIAGLPLRAGASMHFTQQDSAYLVRNFQFNGGFMILPGFELLGSIRAESSSVSDQTAREVVNLNSRGTFFGFGFRFRNIDRLLVPTSGYQLKVMLENGRRFITDDRLDETLDDNFKQTILRTQGQAFFKLGRRQILTPRIETYFIDSPEFLISDLHRFGGAESLRGFREDQFRASGVVWGDLEFRHLLSPDSYLFGFGSFGRFRRPQLINETTRQFEITDSVQSFGFGIAFQTALGFLKVSYAISPDDEISNGKVHVGITAGL